MPENHNVIVFCTTTKNQDKHKLCICFIDVGKMQWSRYWIPYFFKESAKNLTLDVTWGTSMWLLLLKM